MGEQSFFPWVAPITIPICVISFQVTLKTIAKWANRLLLAYTIVDMVGKYINNLLNPPTPPKTPPTQEQKDLLTKLMDAATRLKDIYHSWQEAIKPLKVNSMGCIIKFRIVLQCFNILVNVYFLFINAINSFLFICMYL